MSGLTLKVVSVDAATASQSHVFVFGENGGTIGRDETNSMSLPDKHRRVSRLHATISFPDGVATITNASSSLPISVSEQQLDRGESAAIVEGSLIEIGPYILQASLSATSRPSSSSSPQNLISTGPNSLAGTGSNVAPLPLARGRADPVPSEVDVAHLFGAVENDHAVRPGNLISSADPLQNLLGAPTHSVDRGSTPIESTTVNAEWGDSGYLLHKRTPSPQALPMSRPTTDSLEAAKQSEYQSGGGSSEADPFANLLAGIGNPMSSAQNATSKGYTPEGLSADPLAAFGGANTSAGFTESSERVSRHIDRGALIPDDFNPFEMPSEASRNAADPLAGFIGSAPAQTERVATPPGTTFAPPIDSLFRVGAKMDGTLDPLQSTPSAVGAGQGDLAALLGPTDGSTDPLALFDAPESLPGQRPMRYDSPEVGSAFVPPSPIHVDPLASLAPNSIAPLSAIDPFVDIAGSSPNVDVNIRNFSEAESSAKAPQVQEYKAYTGVVAAPAPELSVAAAAPGLATSSDVLAEAFLRGAGLPPAALPHGLTPEVMSMIGSVLRSATAGALDMLAARAATKREVQASVTIISVQANNPLKFLPNADAAMQLLLGKKMPGFMRADIAMRDAFDDLRAHEVGVIAGTRAALTEVLGKFDPTVLGEKLARGSVIESLIPSARKAKLWDLYLERYLQIRREAEDDFQSIFGRAFVQAYERENARIKGETPLTTGERP